MAQNEFYNPDDGKQISVHRLISMFDSIHQRIDNLAQKIESLLSTVTQLNTKIDKHQRLFDRNNITIESKLESRLETVEEFIHNLRTTFWKGVIIIIIAMFVTNMMDRILPIFGF